MPQDYEIIVVGAGPAGATLAYELASRGINTLILEKAALPRYKCCAGGLTVKAANLLGIDIDEVVENKITGACVSFASESPFIGSYSNTIMYTVRRDKFDYALVKRAEAAGAHLLQGVEVKRVQFSDAGVEVSTSVGDFRAHFVAGADGARSVVASATGIRMSTRHVIGIQTEVRVDEKELLKRKPQITVDLGRIHGGYAWVFPKTDHLSIGIACLANKVRNLKRRYQEFLEALNLGNYSITKFNGGILPVCTGKAVVAKGRAILLGDAAGLADPLTGEGIYHAILSARLAAPVLEQSLGSGEVRLEDYQKSIEKQIMREMKIAHIFSIVLANMPHRLFKVFKDDEKVWRGSCYLLRGEIDYVALKNKISSLGGLYSLILRR